MDRLIRTLLGTSNLRREGYSRALRGFRNSDRRDMWFGLALAAVSVIRNTSNERELLFRKEVPEGSAIVVHHKRRGDPKIEVIKPPR